MRHQVDSTGWSGIAVITVGCRGVLATAGLACTRTVPMRVRVQSSPTWRGSGWSSAGAAPTGRSSGDPQNPPDAVAGRPAMTKSGPARGAAGRGCPMAALLLLPRLLRQRSTRGPLHGGRALLPLPPLQAQPAHELAQIWALIRHSSNGRRPLSQRDIPL